MSGINQHPTHWPVSDPEMRELTWPQAYSENHQMSSFCDVTVLFLSDIERITLFCSVWGLQCKYSICWRSNPRLRSIILTHFICICYYLDYQHTLDMETAKFLLACLSEENSNWLSGLGESVAFHGAHSEQNVSGQLCLGITGILEPWATHYQWELKRHSDILITLHPPESRVEDLYLICFF